MLKLDTQGGSSPQAQAQLSVLPWKHPSKQYWGIYWGKIKKLN